MEMNDLNENIETVVETALNAAVPGRRSRGRRVRKLIADILLGLAVIAVGVGYLGNYLSFCPWTGFDLFFPGWGALFLIVPSVYWLIRKPLSWGWAICLLVGVLILLSKQEGYGFGMAATIVLALFIILVGLRLIFAPLIKRARRRRFKKKLGKSFGAGTTSGDVLFGEGHGGSTADRRYGVSFGERHVKIENEEFVSGTLSVSFGEMRFDLTNAYIPDCAVIDAACSFGELNIYLPAGAKAIVSDSHAFGEVINLHKSPTAPDAPVVYINVDCSFGETNIH